MVGGMGGVLDGWKGVGCGDVWIVAWIDGEVN